MKPPRLGIACAALVLSSGKLRADGQRVHDMHLVRIKGPSESTGKGTFQTLAQSECPHIRK